MAKISFLRYRAVYDDLRERFPHYHKRPDNLLIDIGCGRGDYLKRMKELGWNVLGIEPDIASAALARERGIPIINGTLAEAHLPEGVADQITLQHVIEHLPDPAAAIHECFRLLRKGGRLVIYTPNNESLGSKVFGTSWLPLDPPRHLFVFSSRSIASLLKKSSFREWSIHTVSVSAAKIFDNSLLISNKSKINGNIPVLPQRGRAAFATKEALLCRLGMPYGEEIEAIAFR
jgi:2-polyprenyl-3-methyl-5-hydroxy-6-metoxy-1,4-benzoquinol methylase